MSDSKIEDILLHSIDKLDNKMDKINDKVEEVQRRIVVIDDRQNNSDVERIRQSLEDHFDQDQSFQASIFSEINIMSRSLNHYNNLLDTHIEGVRTLKELHLQNAEKIELYKESLSKRVDILEEPVKAKAWLMNKYTKIAGVISVLVTIVTKILGLW